MWILWMVLVGFLAGTAAKFIMPGKEPGGLVITTLLGIGGAVVAGFLGNLLGLYPQGGIGKFIAAIIGALIILFVYNKMKAKKSG